MRRSVHATSTPLLLPPCDVLSFLVLADTLLSRVLPEVLQGSAVLHSHVTPGGESAIIKWSSPSSPEQSQGPIVEEGCIQLLQVRDTFVLASWVSWRLFAWSVYDCAGLFVHLGRVVWKVISSRASL